MNFSIPAIIRDLAAPEHKLTCPKRLWDRGMVELRRRGEGLHESGAFLLGLREGDRCTVHRFIYYDDLDPHCLDSGIVVLDGYAFGKLWAICREVALSVVADVHTHPGSSYQSTSDRNNPMIGVAGHIAIIVPNLARRPVKRPELGIYEYLGDHRWQSYRGQAAARFFYIGLWS